MHRFPPTPRVRRVAGLYHKVSHDARERALVVGALERELYKVATRQRCLSREEFDINVAVRGGDHHLTLRGRLQGVDLRHVASGGARARRRRRERGGGL